MTAVSTQNTLVSEIMTEKVQTISFNDTVASALRIMVDGQHTMLPVIDRDRHCVGMLSRSDLTEMLIEEDQELSRLLDSEIGSYASKSSTVVDTSAEKLVRELMTHEIVKVQQDSTIGEACQKMIDHQIHHLPVVDDEGRLEGIVSTFDVIKLLVD